MPLTVLPSGLTEAETEHLTRYLTHTMSDLREVTNGLSEAQWQFKPAADRWSIAEILEHLVLVESRMQHNVKQMPGAAEPPPDFDQALVDEVLPQRVASRATRVMAPEAIHPTGTVSGAKSLQTLSAIREETIELVSAPSLRGHVVIHPIGGPMDGYHWLAAAAAHAARHTEQIQEIKADPGFPQST